MTTRPPHIPPPVWERMGWLARQKATVHWQASLADQDGWDIDAAVTAAADRYRARPRVARMAALYLSGLTAAQVGAAVGRSETVVLQALERAGVPRRVPGPTLPAVDGCGCDGSPGLYNRGHRCARVRAARRERERSYQARRRAAS